MDLRHVASQSYTNVPLIEVVRRWLCQHPVGTLITTSVRKLARAVGRPRSTGAITPVLNTLEADGWIARDADGEGTVIEVKRSDPSMDHPVGAPQGAQPIATQSAAMQGDQLIDRLAPAPEGDQLIDRPACMDDHDLNQHKQQQHACGVTKKATASPNKPAWFPPDRWQRCVATAPTFTAEQAQTLAAKIATRHGTRHHVHSPCGLIETHLRTGEPILSLSEIQAQAAAIAAQFAPPPSASRSAAVPERSAQRNRVQPAPVQSKPATHADADAEARRAYIERIAPPDANDAHIELLVDCYDRGMTEDAARRELEAVYVDG